MIQGCCIFIKILLRINYKLILPDRYNDCLELEQKFFDHLLLYIPTKFTLVKVIQKEYFS